MVAVTMHAALVSLLPYDTGGGGGSYYLYRCHQFDRLRPLCRFGMNIVVIDFAFGCPCFLPRRRWSG
jgi:hypothetical protein